MTYVFLLLAGKSTRFGGEIPKQFLKVKNKYIFEYPLKTFDSVARFKRPIIRILDGWLNDKEIRDKLVFQASLSAQGNDKKEIEKDVIE